MALPLPFGLSLSGHCVAGRTAADLGHGVAVVSRQVLSEVVREGIFASGGQIAVVRLEPWKPTANAASIPHT